MVCTRMVKTLFFFPPLFFSTFRNGSRGKGSNLNPE